MSEFQGTPIRNAAKAVLTDEEGRYLTLRTPIGIFNIPGGGIDNGEEPRDALLRELNEELPSFAIHCLSSVPIGCVEGRIIRDRWARWQVFSGKVRIPSELNVKEPGQVPGENSYFELLTLEEVKRAETNGSLLATRAILLADAVANRDANGFVLRPLGRLAHQTATG